MTHNITIHTIRLSLKQSCLNQCENVPSFAGCHVATHPFSVSCESRGILKSMWKMFCATCPLCAAIFEFKTCAVYARSNEDARLRPISTSSAGDAFTETRTILIVPPLSFLDLFFFFLFFTLTFWIVKGADQNWPKSKLAEVEIARSRNGPKSTALHVVLLCFLVQGAFNPSRRSLSLLPLPESLVHWQ